MKIEKNKFVSLSYTLTDDKGIVIDQATDNDPLGFVWGKGQIIPGLENTLEGMSTNETKKVQIPPEDGYGNIIKELFQEIPLENFPQSKDITKGQQFQTNTPHGTMTFTVAEIKEDKAIVDLNHPLAGQNLNFEIKIVEVRDATPEELEPPKHNCSGEHNCNSCC